MRKSFAALTLTALALAASLIFGLMDRYSASAQQTTGIAIPNASIYAINAENVLFVLKPGATRFTRLFRVKTTDGNLIGIDFRPADGLLYAVTDVGSIYTINLTSGAATLVSNITVNGATTRFPAGYQSLMDFNPVISAIRLIGSNCQNYAVINNAGGNLNAAAIQSNLSYAGGDVNAGKTPNVSAGSYTNNFVGAANTLFYGIDFDLDTFVTIQPSAPGGSSATGGGVLQTLGRLVTPNGAPVNVSPTADFDIYSDGNGGNGLIGVSGRTLFSIDLSQINQAQALGTTQNVVARGIAMDETGGGFIDIAVSTAAPTPNPTPTPTPTPNPTPTPTPSAITLQAENAMLGGGSKVATTHAGFTGRGFVDFADNIANSFVEFSLNHTGPRTLRFRYANAGAANRTCNITINGVSAGSLSFPPTGAWTSWKTISLSVNLGATAGNKAVRVTSTTNAGGPNLDKLTVQ
ncbi:MAG: DUF4394 domain-containing protein [Blastocatellales bacterium]